MKRPNASEHAVTMSDMDIIDALTVRSEQGLTALSDKYGSLCKRISINLLGNREDAEECVNDTLLAVWNRIPPERPDSLVAFVTRIIRNISIDRIRKRTTQKRDGGTALLLDELSECLPDPNSQQIPEEVALDDVLEKFLASQTAENRTILVRRYFMGEDFSEIAKVTGLRTGTIRVRLHRLREELKIYLEKNDIFV